MMFNMRNQEAKQTTHPHATVQEGKHTKIIHIKNAISLEKASHIG